VLTELTGTPYFPDGQAHSTIERGALLHEEGPTDDVDLQWATYFDAADQAGISRIYGGIHIPQDDVEGRIIGSQVGLAAWDHALTYFDGTANS
jgi:hypothetical protein